VNFGCKHRRAFESATAPHHLNFLLVGQCLNLACRQISTDHILLGPQDLVQIVAPLPLKLHEERGLTRMRFSNEQTSH
jgi:hypothetical protein